MIKAVRADGRSSLEGGKSSPRGLFAFTATHSDSKADLVLCSRELKKVPFSSMLRLSACLLFFLTMSTSLLVRSFSPCVVSRRNGCFKGPLRSVDRSHRLTHRRATRATTGRVVGICRLFSSNSPSNSPSNNPLGVDEEVDPGAVPGTDYRIVKYPHPSLRLNNEECTPEQVRFNPPNFISNTTLTHIPLLHRSSTAPPPQNPR